MTCSTHSGDKKALQHFSRKTWRDETTQETQAYMGR